MESTTKTRDVLAKLLASENLSIEYRNISTAFFDLKSRTIYLPILKIGSEDMYSLFTLHEVGHALFTPTVAWLELGKTKPPEYMYFLNVVEDARIERRIQRLYPGSRQDFVNGYKTIFNENTMFNVSKINDSTLIDRLNIYAKLGMLISIRFSDEEKLIVNELNAVESWEDTLNLVDKLYAQHKNNQQNAASNKTKIAARARPAAKDADKSPGDQSPGNSNSEEDAEDAEDANKSPGGQSPGDSNFEEDAEDANKSPGNSNSEEDAEDADKSSDDGNSGSKKGEEEPAKVEEINDAKLGETVDAIDKALNSYVDQSTAHDTSTLTLTQQFPLEDFIIPVDGMLKLIVKQEEALLTYPTFRPVPRDNTVLAKFVVKNKTNLNYMISRFESKKSASNYVRSKISKSGMIDCNKLHQYRISEDLFKRVTVLPNGKNHGLILIVDFSSSMAGPELRGVCAQLINIIMFCRRGKIKHEVYAFSNDKAYDDLKVLSAVSIKAWDSMEFSMYGGNMMSRFDRSIRLLELFNDRMSQANFEFMCVSLLRFTSNYHLKLFHLNTTPLNESLFLTRKIIQRFKNRTNAEIVNCVYLTDGDADSEAKTKRTLIVRDDAFTAPMRFEAKTSVTSIFTKLLKLTTNVNLINFRLLSTGADREFNRLANYTGSSTSQLRNAFKKNLALKFEHIMGFDEWYLIESNVLLVHDLEIPSTNHAGKDQLKKLNTSFLASSKKRAAQRTILSNFIDKIY